MTDATGHTLTLKKPPQRVVSLVPSLSELLWDLGLPPVGRTRFCTAPGDIERVPVVGGTKDFKPDKIRALQPDLILANREENVAEPLLELRQDIPVWTTAVEDLPGALKMIRDVGQLTGRATAAKALREEIEQGFEELSPLPEPPTAVYLIWRKPWMAVGGDTFIHDMLTRLGLRNLLGTQARYPSLSPEALATLNPQHILLSSEPYPFKEKHARELRDCCPEARLHFVDGALFSWYGSRLRETAKYLKTLQEQVLYLP